MLCYECAEFLDESTLELAMNSLALLGQANKWLSCRREEHHKRAMDPKLHYLCSATASYTYMLYNDSIVMDIKDIQDMNKVSRNLSFCRSQYRGGRRIFTFFERCKETMLSKRVICKW
jgi:hypothetical protein